MPKPMSYLKKPNLLQQQQELKEFVDKRLKSEEPKVKERVYQWLNDNQYFTDNELFDFYFCVAQNIAAVEVLGVSGDRILQVKAELEQSAFVYVTQVKDISEEFNQKLKYQLHSVRESQEKLDLKFNQVLEGLRIERENLKIISTGLVNSASVLLKKQKQLLVETEAARKLVFQSVIIAWVILSMALLGSLVLSLLVIRR